MGGGRGSRSRKAAAAARTAFGGADTRTKAPPSLDVVIEDAESPDVENVVPPNGEVQVTATKDEVVPPEPAAEHTAEARMTSSAGAAEITTKLTVDVAAANSDATSSTAASTPTSASAPTPLIESAVSASVSSAPSAGQAVAANTARAATVTVDSLTVASVGLAPLAPPPPFAAPTAPLAPPPLPLPPHGDAGAAPVITPQVPHEMSWSYPSTYRDRLRALGFAAMRRGPIWRPYAVGEQSPGWANVAGADTSMPAAQALGLITQHDIHVAAHAASATAAAHVASAAAAAAATAAAARPLAYTSPFSMISPAHTLGVPMMQPVGVHGPAYGPAYAQSVLGRPPLHPLPSAVLPAGLGLPAPPLQAHVGSVHALAAPHLHTHVGAVQTAPAQHMQAHVGAVQAVPAPHPQAHVGSVQAVPGVGLCSTGPQIPAPFPPAPPVLPQAVAAPPPSAAVLPAPPESAAPTNPQLLLSIAMGQGSATAGLSSMEIAEQLRAAAPCSYDD